MTALYLDGFDHYGTGSAGISNMLDGTWAAIGNNFSVGTPTWGTANTGPNCLIMSPISTAQNARIVVPGAPAVLFASFYFALDFLPPFTGANLMDVRSVGNVIQHTLAINPTGSVSLYAGDSTGTLIATTAGPVIKAQTWHLIELEVNYSSGTFILRVDDTNANLTPVISASIGTGKVNGFFAFSWDAVGGTTFGNYYFDDLFIRNNAGSVNNTWLGDRRVAWLLVNADTTTAGWTPNFYQKFGAGVLRLANMQTNNNTPVNPNACVLAPAATSLDVGSSDFTLETFIRFEALPAASQYATIFNRWDAAGNHRSYRFILGGSSFNAGSLQFDYSTDGTAGTISTPIVYPFTPNLNQWYHVAVVRASNELLLFVDGQQLGLPIPVSATFFGAGAENFALGAESGSVFGGVVANTYVTGLYDETRFTNGFARYTTAFSPPASPFPRGAGSDPQWADVVLLCSYDISVADESSFLRPLSLSGGASQFTVKDGTAVGTFSTIGKAVPDDNTFIAAGLTSATGILTMTVQPTAGDTVTVGTKNGATAAVYTFRTSTSSAFDVLIDTTAQNTLLNLISAINAGAGAGTKYGTGTTANFDVVASQLPVGQMLVTASTAGTAGNSVASTATGIAATWGHSTLQGGASIPGPSDFKLQHPPANTTIISAMQLTARMYKSDSGVCTVQNGFVGPLGTLATGSTHALATSADYYLDVFEADPDTTASITPATLINGSIQINRTA